ncbi:MAG: SprT family zinc-dependent metalloprotease [Gammaproteobacteria bacterium]|jgi:predicted metal-dependent hydrolase|nr:SprT family zinc-dependent metalloprotease [Gammaproteobacteria bacterium]
MPQQLNLLLPAEAQTGSAEPGWRVRFSRRARHLKIQVFPHGGVEIVVPPRTSAREVEAFVSSHQQWIADTRARFVRQRPAEPALPDCIPLRSLEMAVPVSYRLNGAGQARAREESSGLDIEAPTLTPPVVWPLLRNWLKARGRAYLPARAMQLGAELGLQPRAVHVRLQRTRWGSCSASGTLSLNAALLLRPPEQLRYVLVHELCHLRHMNHSRRFWSLVERHVPNYRSLDQQLDSAWEAAPNWLIG